MTTERQAAEHAARWKADSGKAPHYSRAFLAAGWTCYACPLTGCDWHHDDRVDRPSDPAAVDALAREHLASHDVADWVRALQEARDGAVASRESNNRAWDVVQLHRLRACHRGEDPYSDPVQDVLAAALIGSEDHEKVRAEINRLGETVAGARDSASVPIAQRLPPATGSVQPKTFPEIMDAFWREHNATSSRPTRTEQ
jgi:hypothetical protein